MLTLQDTSSISMHLASVKFFKTTRKTN